MPAGISALAPSTDASSFGHETKDPPPALTILQRDGLDSSLPLLHVNEEDEMIGPGPGPGPPSNLGNAKRDVTRNDDLYGRRRISRSNEHLVLASLQANQVNPLRTKQGLSKSQDCLDDEGKAGLSAPFAGSARPSLVLSTEDFNEVLNAKLRRIQEQTETDQGRRSPKKALSQRKPFITTVKTGEFLLPPPEVAALLGIAPTGANNNDEGATAADGICPLRSRFKPLVASRRPEVRHSSHNARCPAALKATVDFSLGTVNATAIAAAAAVSTLDERARTFKRSEPT